MKLAPYGVAGLIFSMTATIGLEIVQALVWFVGTVIAGLLIQLLVVYSIAVYFVARRSPRVVFQGHHGGATYRLRNIVFERHTPDIYSSGR
jgi:DAACS family dicarboxylate/amino acid:cation (Na+ or H+) symporter